MSLLATHYPELDLAMARIERLVPAGYDRVWAFDCARRLHVDSDLNFAQACSRIADKLAAGERLYQPMRKAPKDGNVIVGFYHSWWPHVNVEIDIKWAKSRVCNGIDVDEGWVKAADESCADGPSGWRPKHSLTERRGEAHAQ